ncbi:MAG: hypothetical protein JWR18_693 [Segetibacter sp.]|jgi:hypothetical protein|nr:hypothetical protein [Segetibacter sp.]
MKVTHVLIFAIVLAIPRLGIAQNDTTTVKKNVFTAGINYQSALHYFGRTDSLKSSGLFPTIGFQLKEGFYVNSNFIFVNNSVSSFSYNGTIVEGGFRFPQTKNFSGNIFYTQFLYKDKSQLVQSALHSQTGINLTYNNKIVNVNVGGDAKFSDKTDFGATAGLDHLFLYLIPNTKNAIAVNPSAYAYAGTQNFTNTYYKKQNVLGLPVGNPRAVTETSTRFNVLAYEFSAPVVFVAGKFNASITPSYVIPKNLVKIANRPDLSENGQNMFYVSAGIGVRL